MSNEPLAVRVSQPIKLPSRKDLSQSIRGIKKRLKSEVNRESRRKLKDIKRELQWLKDRL